MDRPSGKSKHKLTRNTGVERYVRAKINADTNMRTVKYTRDTVMASEPKGAKPAGRKATATKPTKKQIIDNVQSQYSTLLVDFASARTATTVIETSTFTTLM